MVLTSNGYRALPWYAAVDVQSSVYNFTLSGSTTQILSPNNRRIAATFSCPTSGGGGSAGAPTANMQVAGPLTFTTSPTNYFNYTVPANTGVLLSTMFGKTTSGSAPNMQPFFQRSSTQYILNQTIGQGSIQVYNCWFNTGDMIYMNVSGATGGTIFMWMSFVNYAGGGGGSSFAGVGFNPNIQNGSQIGIFPGDRPVTLDYTVMGAQLWQAVYAYGSSAGVPLTVIETTLLEGLSAADALSLAKTT
jgi:hypothetical protein